MSDEVKVSDDEISSFINMLGEVDDDGVDLWMVQLRSEKDALMARNVEIDAKIEALRRRSPKYMLLEKYMHVFAGCNIGEFVGLTSDRMYDLISTMSVPEFIDILIRNDITCKMPIASFSTPFGQKGPVFK